MIKIYRFFKTDKVTIGSAVANNQFIFNTVELPDKNNAKQISCIPVGKYKAVKRYSAKYGNHFHILDVPNRELILMHKANKASELLGCLGVGMATGDINSDGIPDVVHSKLALNNLLAIMPDEFELVIVDVALAT